MTSVDGRTTSLEVVDRIDLDGKHAVVSDGHFKNWSSDCPCILLLQVQLTPR